MKEIVELRGGWIMLMDILAIVAVLAFVILVIYLVIVLIALKKTLQRVDHLIYDTELKFQNFNSALRIVSNLGDIGQSATENLKRTYWTRRSKEDGAIPKNDLISDWVTTSIKLGCNLFLKR
jgi:hypothetical protein